MFYHFDLGCRTIEHKLLFRFAPPSKCRENQNGDIYIKLRVTFLYIISNKSSCRKIDEMSNTYKIRSFDKC